MLDQRLVRLGYRVDDLLVPLRIQPVLRRLWVCGLRRDQHEEFDQPRLGGDTLRDLNQQPEDGRRVLIGDPSRMRAD